MEAQGGCSGPTRTLWAALVVLSSLSEDPTHVDPSSGLTPPLGQVLQGDSAGSS
jgi:hypothetical protein